MARSAPRSTSRARRRSRPGPSCSTRLVGTPDPARALDGGPRAAAPSARPRPAARATRRGSSTASGSTRRRSPPSPRPRPPRLPLLLVLEDAHLADAASLALLAHVGRRLRGLPALLLVTRRPAPPSDALDAVERPPRRAPARSVPASRSHRCAPEDAATLVRAAATLDDADVRRAVARRRRQRAARGRDARARSPPAHTGPPPSLRTHGPRAAARPLAPRRATSPSCSPSRDARSTPPSSTRCRSATPRSRRERGPRVRAARGRRRRSATGMRCCARSPTPRSSRRAGGSCTSASPTRCCAPGGRQPAEVARHLRRAGPRRARRSSTSRGRPAGARDLAALARGARVRARGRRPAARATPSCGCCSRTSRRCAAATTRCSRPATRGSPASPPHDRRARGLALVERGTVAVLGALLAGGGARRLPRGARAARRARTTSTPSARACSPRRRGRRRSPGDPARVDDLLAAAAELGRPAEDDRPSTSTSSPRGSTR